MCDDLDRLTVTDGIRFMYIPTGEKIFFCFEIAVYLCPQFELPLAKSSSQQCGKRICRHEAAGNCRYLGTLQAITAC